MRKAVYGFFYFSIAFCLGVTLFAIPAFAATCTSYTVQNTAYSFGYSTGSFSKVAQAFTPSATCTVTAINSMPYKNNSPTDNVVVSLYTNTSSAPGTLLETGSSIAASSLGSTVGVYATSTFAGTTVLTAGTEYWIVWSRSGSLDTSNYYRIGADQSSAVVPYGLELDSGTWSSSGSQNFVYKIQQADPIVSPPTVFSRTATSTCVTVTSGVCTSWVTSSLEEVTYLDYLYPLGIIIFLLTFQALGFFFAGYKRPVISDFK
jgi:hypothetical protein